MMMDLPHLQLRGSIYRYRRRVPTPLQQALGKAMFFISLGNRDRGFLARYQKVHADVEAQLRQARITGEPTPMELGRWAENEIARLGLDPEWDGRSDPDYDDPEYTTRDVIADGIASHYPVDDVGHPVGVTARDAALLRALMLGKRQKRAPSRASSVRGSSIASG